MLNAMNDNGKHFLESLSIRRARRLPVSMSTGRGGTIVALVQAVAASLSAPPKPPDRDYIAHIANIILRRPQHNADNNKRIYRVGQKK